MKRTILVLAAALLTAVSVNALGELGFAEVNRDNVNMRRAPGGKIIARLDAPQSVFVTEERQENGYLWCHINTFVGKNTEDGWIRGDMLRFVSDEFTDIVSVQAGDHYATGIRSDGTAAILGDDMPHLPCVDTVRTWYDIAQITSSTCSVYALDKAYNLLAVGRNSMYGTDKAAKLCGNEPILLDEHGRVMPETWNWAKEGQYDESYYDTGAIGDALCETALSNERMLLGVLTKDGRIICTGEMEALQTAFEHIPYTAADADWNHIIALRTDGRVDAAGMDGLWDSGMRDVSGWTGVVSVAAGSDHCLGLKADGTVYYAGDDNRHRAQIEAWSDIVQIDAGNGYSIALRADGSVVMAGAYVSYDR